MENKQSKKIYDLDALYDTYTRNKFKNDQDICHQSKLTKPYTHIRNNKVTSNKEKCGIPQLIIIREMLYRFEEPKNLVELKNIFRY